MTHEENVKRFWSKVVICRHGMPCRRCCWLWLASASPEIYGQWQTADGQHISAHRFMVELVHGARFLLYPAPANSSYTWKYLPTFYALHTCDVHACVNPCHLFVGAAKDNVLDAILKGRWRPCGKPMRRFRTMSENQASVALCLEEPHNANDPA